MKTQILLVVLLLASPATAEDLCSPPEDSDREGHWPIREEAFSRENALNAAKSLHDIVSDRSHEDVQAVGPTCAIQNHYTIIKRYMLKAELDGGKKGGPGYDRDLAYFCDFVQSANVCHLARAV